MILTTRPAVTEFEWNGGNDRRNGMEFGLNLTEMEWLGCTSGSFSPAGAGVLLAQCQTGRKNYFCSSHYVLKFLQHCTTISVNSPYRCRAPWFSEVLKAAMGACFPVSVLELPILKAGVHTKNELCFPSGAKVLTQ